MKAAGTIQFLPLRGMTCGTGFWLEEHAASRDPSRSLPTDCALVSRGYFAAMGIPVLDGRPFDRRDRIASPRVLIVNQSFAKRYFPDGRVLGRRILVQASNQALAEIVGVVGDVRHNGLTSEPAPTVFLLHAQTPGYITNLVVRTTGDPMRPGRCHPPRHSRGRPDAGRVGASGRWSRTSRECSRRPRLHAALVTPLRGDRGDAGGDRRLRPHRLCRDAADARDRDSSGARRDRGGRSSSSCSGRARGSCSPASSSALPPRSAFAAMVSTFVFGVTPGDPLTYLLAALAFSGVALAAVIVPARRASRVEPISALRFE